MNCAWIKMRDYIFIFIVSNIICVLFIIIVDIWRRINVQNDISKNIYHCDTNKRVYSTGCKCTDKHTTEKLYTVLKKNVPNP